jgi:hypothetical protein
MLPFHAGARKARLRRVRDAIAYAVNADKWLRHLNGEEDVRAPENEDEKTGGPASLRESGAMPGHERTGRR